MLGKAKRTVEKTILLVVRGNTKTTNELTDKARAEVLGIGKPEEHYFED